MINIMEQKIFVLRIYVNWWHDHTKRSSYSSCVSKVKIKTVINSFISGEQNGSVHFPTTGLNINYYIDFYLSKQSQNQDLFSKTLNEGYRVIDF